MGFDSGCFVLHGLYKYSRGPDIAVASIADGPTLAVSKSFVTVSTRCWGPSSDSVVFRYCKCPNNGGTMLCMVTHIATVWINQVRLSVLHVVSSTGKMNISLSAFVPENLVSLDRFGSPVPRQPAHLYTPAESGAYLRDSSRVPRRRPFIHLKPPYAIGSVPSLSGHVIAYRWHSLPRVRRFGASKRQSSSERVLPWQVTMDQLIFVSLSHTHYWYKVGMSKVPAAQGTDGPSAPAANVRMWHVKTL